MQNSLETDLTDPCAVQSRPAAAQARPCAGHMAGAAGAERCRAGRADRVPPRSSIWRGLPISAEAEPGTLLRNGHTLRRFNLELADHVEQAARRKASFRWSSAAIARCCSARSPGCGGQAAFARSMSTATAISAIRAIMTPDHAERGRRHGPGAGHRTWRSADDGMARRAGAAGAGRASGADRRARGPRARFRLGGRQRYRLQPHRRVRRAQDRRARPSRRAR